MDRKTPEEESISRMRKYLQNVDKNEIKEFFDKLPKPPKGWVSIDEFLPMCLAIDYIRQGYTEYKVMDANGKEFITHVCDHGVWLYEYAKPNNITHWFNP